MYVRDTYGRPLPCQKKSKKKTQTRSLRGTNHVMTPLSAVRILFPLCVYVTMCWFLPGTCDLQDMYWYLLYSLIDSDTHIPLSISTIAACFISVPLPSKLFYLCLDHASTCALSVPVPVCPLSGTPMKTPAILPELYFDGDEYVRGGEEKILLAQPCHTEEVASHRSPMFPSLDPPP